MLKEGKIAVLLSEANEAHTGRVAKLTKTASVSASTKPIAKTARASILAGAGAVGRACKLAFSYGLETDPGIAAKFLAKLTMSTRHSHIRAHVPRVKPLMNCIPLKAAIAAFSGMPKKSAAHRDGWTWELLRDAAHTHSMTTLLRKFVERFSNGALPQDLWAYLASTPFYTHSTNNCMRRELQRQTRHSDP